MNAVDKNGNTCLHKLFKASANHLLLMHGSQLAILKKLLEAGADVNVVNKKNKTPLLLACESNRDLCAAVLASHPGKILNWKKIHFSRNECEFSRQ